MRIVQAGLRMHPSNSDIPIYTLVWITVVALAMFVFLAIVGSIIPGADSAVPLFLFLSVFPVFATLAGMLAGHLIASRGLKAEAPPASTSDKPALTVDESEPVETVRGPKAADTPMTADPDPDFVAKGQLAIKAYRHFGESSS
jgi:hypothetical protein